MVSKAPAGGIVSHVNGQYYKGGEFTPDHGKYCGKGRNRVTATRFKEVKAAVEAAGKVLEYNEKLGRFQVKTQGGNVLFFAANLETLAKCF